MCIIICCRSASQDPVPSIVDYIARNKSCVANVHLLDVSRIKGLISSPLRLCAQGCLMNKYVACTVISSTPCIILCFQSHDDVFNLILRCICALLFPHVFVCLFVCLFDRLFALRLLAGYPQLNNILQIANILLFCRFSAVARCSYIEIRDVRVHGSVCLVLGKTAPRSRTRVSATIGITSPASVRFARC